MTDKEKVGKWRSEIALLRSESEGSSRTQPLIYLDNSATLLKSQVVVDAIQEYYEEYPANIHRGTYGISIRASEAYEAARRTVKKFFGADDSYELFFTSGMTAGSNFLAHAHREILTESDTVVSSIIEHHSSFLPWREVCKQTGARLAVIHLDEEHKISMKNMETELCGAKVCALSGMSNVNGYEPELDKIYQLCNSHNCRLVIDACQLAVHRKIDLSRNPYDALLCSAHKLGGPMGIGAIIIKKNWVDNFSQVISGGGTVSSVRLEDVEYIHGPERFEAGTPNVAGAIGFARALEYLETYGWDFIIQRDTYLRECLVEQIKRLKKVSIVGGEDISNAPIVSFVSPLHPQDTAFALQSDNICIRDGKLCAEPMLQYFQLSQVTRASAFCYNTIEELEIFGNKLELLNSLF